MGITEMSAPYAFLVAIVLSLVYGALSIAAFSHVRPEEKKRRSYVLLLTDPWWPYYKECFTDAARTPLLYGKILFPAVIAAWVIWGVLQS